MTRPGAGGLRGRWAAGALMVTVAATLAGCGAEPLAPLPVRTADPRPVPSVGASSRVPAADPIIPAPPSVPAATTRRPRRATAPPAPRPAPGRATVVTTTRVSTSAGPAAPVTTSPPTDCFGAVRHEIDLQQTVLDLIPSLCFRIGGTLRMYRIGPGLVTATPEDLRTMSYEAAVQDVRFTRPGTVEVTIPLDEQTYVITVVVTD